MMAHTAMFARFATLAAPLALLVAAHVDPTAPRVHTVPLFSIAKSENRNQVQYAVHVDESCAPVADAPVFAYWRMLEQGPGHTEPLLSREARAYGLASQQVVARSSDGGEVRVVLHAIPGRAIAVQTGRAPDGDCHASAALTINGVPAHLVSVFVQLKRIFGVDYLLLQGRSSDGTRTVTERLSG